MSTEFDPFKLSSGLPLADTDVTLSAGEFKFDLEYNPDTVVAALTFTPDEEGAEEATQLYSCGKNFEPSADGSEVSHESGKSVNFSQNSNYGRFLSHALECEGFREYAIDSGYTPFEMALWQDTRWHLTGVEIEVKNPSKPNEPAKMRTVIVPDIFYGVGEEEEEKPKTAAKKTAAKKTAAAPKTAAKKAAGGSAATKKAISDLEDENPDLLEALRELAGEHDEHDTFMEAALEVDGVSDSRAAEKVVMDSKEGSVFAAAQ